MTYLMSFFFFGDLFDEFFSLMVQVTYLTRESGASRRSLWSTWNDFITFLQCQRKLMC